MSFQQTVETGYFLFSDLREELSRLELSLFELVFLESSFELLSFDELSLAELSLELSFELSFEESSDLGLLSSFLESPPLSDDGA